MQVTKTEIVDILTDIIGVLGILVSFQVVVMNMVPSKYLPYAIGFFAIIKWKSCQLLNLIRRSITDYI